MEAFVGVRRVSGIPGSSRDSSGRFVNIFGFVQAKVPLTKILSFVFGAKPAIPSNIMDLVASSKDVLKRLHRKEDAIASVWGGHACFVTTLDNGITFATDPVLDERCGPLGLMGPKRITPPAFSKDELKSFRVDFVVISHSHYDHLEVATVKALGDSTKWYVPLGLKEWFASQGVTNVVELDWGEQVTHFKDHQTYAIVTALPCQHWSRRTLLDRNKTLWTSFAVHSRRSAVFFGGDTGYCSAFKLIGDRLGPFDLSFIGIGAYEPRDMMCGSHASPADAVKMHLDLRSKKSVGMHFGTWILSREEVWAPKSDLETAAAQNGLKSDEFVTWRIGQINHVGIKT